MTKLLWAAAIGMFIAFAAHQLGVETDHEVATQVVPPAVIESKAGAIEQRRRWSR